MSESNPLVQRVDALLKRHQQQAVGPGDGLPPGSPAAEAPPPIQDAAAEPDALAPEAFIAAETLPGEPVPAPADDDIPILTEIVDAQAWPAPGPADLESLGARIGAEVLEKLLAEFDSALDRELGRRIGELLERSVDGLRAELSASARRLLRDAVAAAVARALEEEARRP